MDRYRDRYRGRIHNRELEAENVSGRSKGASSPSFFGGLFFGGLVCLLVLALSIPVYSIVHAFGSDKVYLTTEAPTAANQTPGPGRRTKSVGRQLFIDNCGSCHTLTAAAVSG